MSQAEFNRFAREYETLHARCIRASGEEPEFFARYKIEDVARIAMAQGRPPKEILDFGAGVGTSVLHWRRELPESSLTCLDVSEDSVNLARARYAGQAEFHVYEGTTIPLSDGRFDVVFAACVFHHIELHRQVPLLAELRRVLTKDGKLFIFEHNPLNPLTAHVFNTCEFDVRATMIRAGVMRKRLLAAGFVRTALAYRIFFPGALRNLRPMERALKWLPIGAQYRLVAQ